MRARELNLLTSSECIILYEFRLHTLQPGELGVKPANRRNEQRFLDAHFMATAPKIMLPDMKVIERR